MSAEHEQFQRDLARRHQEQSWQPCHSFAELLERSKPLAPIMEKIVRQRVLGSVIQDGTVQLAIDKIRVPELEGFLDGLWRKGGVTALNELYIMAHLINQGPKVFRPSLSQCEALGQIEPGLSVGDYTQPYPVMVVELPKEYRRTRCVDLQEWTAGGSESMQVRGEPLAVILKHEPEIPVLYSSVCWGGSYSVARCLHHFHGTSTIAEILHSEDPAPDGSMPVSEREMYLTDQLTCLAVNAMVLLCDYGHKELGPDNPGYADRLGRYIKVAKKRKRGVEEAARNLRLLPKVYGFAQTVCLHDEVAEAPPAGADTPGSGGWTVQPHWRRGHYRRQHHGHGNSQTKRILVKPKLINRWLLTGPDAHTSTVYLSDREDIRAHAQGERQAQKAAANALELARLQQDLQGRLDKS